MKYWIMLTLFAILFLSLYLGGFFPIKIKEGIALQDFGQILNQLNSGGSNETIMRNLQSYVKENPHMTDPLYLNIINNVDTQGGPPPYGNPPDYDQQVADLNVTVSQNPDVDDSALNAMANFGFITKDTQNKILNIVNNTGLSYTKKISQIKVVGGLDDSPLYKYVIMDPDGYYKKKEGLNHTVQIDDIASLVKNNIRIRN